MSHARIIIIALPCWSFELSPLNNLYREKLVHSLTLIPFELFNYSLCTSVSSQESV